MCGSANIGCRTCMGGSLLVKDDLIVRSDAIVHVEPVVENWLVSAPRRRFSTYTLAELVSEQLLPPQDTNPLSLLFSCMAREEVKAMICSCLMHPLILGTDLPGFNNLLGQWLGMRSLTDRGV